MKKNSIVALAHALTNLHGSRQAKRERERASSKLESSAMRKRVNAQADAGEITHATEL